MKIIGYIHICQKEGWKKSFDLLWNSLQKGLYNATYEIRVGIVNDEGIIIPDERLQDAKINIVYVGKSQEYERATLHHMREQSEKEDALYYYLHTKGLSKFGTVFENNVIDWIKLMLYWNIEKWQLAYNTLVKRNYYTYGCDKTKVKHHLRCYSGNFWWATSEHIKTLSKIIGPDYNDPEFWITRTNNDKQYTVFNSGLEDWGDHYTKPCPENTYKII